MALPRIAAFAMPLLLLVTGAGCGGDDVNCENLCKHTLACEVSFAPSDDVNGKKILTGERTDLESCTLGCEENPRVTVESASCVDKVEVTTPEQCQEPVLDCFGAGTAE